MGTNQQGDKPKKKKKKSVKEPKIPLTFAPLEFEEALRGLLETKPPPKAKRKGKSDDKDKSEDCD
jgi:hypothetical protein